ncbi:MAG: hypothetical protein EOO93_27860 [Pedobacter sp.]|nr:MAG: hypothetical protein EOO93_27860 [Pedobacter sp.]
MKNLNLENFGVQEMDAREMASIDGGGFFGALLGFVVGAAVGILAGGGTINGAHSDDWFHFALIGAAVGAAAPF